MHDGRDGARRRDNEPVRVSDRDRSRGGGEDGRGRERGAPGGCVALVAASRGSDNVATRPQTVWSLCFSVIPGSVMVTRTILEGFIVE